MAQAGESAEGNKDKCAIENLFHCTGWETITGSLLYSFPRYTSSESNFFFFFIWRTTDSPAKNCTGDLKAEPCKAKVVHYFEERLETVEIVGGVLAALELLSLLLATCLLCMRKGDKGTEYERLVNDVRAENRNYWK